MSNLEELEAKIRKLCPELQELSMGCEVRHYFNGKVGQFLGMIDEHGSCDCYVSYDCGATISRDDMSDLRKCIIGHPIHIEHILKCLSKSLPEGDVINTHVNSYNNLTFRPVTKNGLIDWELDKPLNKQSERTIAFLNSVIK